MSQLSLACKFITTRSLAFKYDIHTDWSGYKLLWIVSRLPLFNWSTGVAACGDASDAAAADGADGADVDAAARVAAGAGAVGAADAVAVLYSNLYNTCVQSFN